MTNPSPKSITPELADAPPYIADALMDIFTALNSLNTNQEVTAVLAFAIAPYIKDMSSSQYEYFHKYHRSIIDKAVSLYYPENKDV